MAPKCHFRLFLLRGISYPRRPKLPMRTVRRLRLRYLLFGTICVLLPSFLSHHVETKSSPKNTLFQMHFLEKEGVEPSSTAPSIGGNYNNSLIIKLYCWWYVFYSKFTGTCRNWRWCKCITKINPCLRGF